jgi:hypothetical protein
LRKLVIPAVTLLMTLGFTPKASAATFTLDSYLVTYNQVDPGLKLVVTPIVPLGGDFTTPDLQVGDSYYFDLFHLAANEGSIEPDDYATKPISVTFNFNPPLASGNLGGTTIGGEICGFFLCGESASVSWNNPLVLNFGNGGQFTLALDNAVFAGGLNGLNFWNGANIGATLTYTAASVPEPASMALFGMGALGLAARLRRRRQ